MTKRWTLALAVLVGLVLAALAQGPPIIIPRLLSSRTDLLVFRNVLDGIDDRTWQVAFGAGPCRSVEFVENQGRYSGQFQFRGSTSPLTCQLRFAYDSLAQIPAVPPDRLSYGINALFLNLRRPVVIDSLVSLEFMEHVLDALPAELTQPFNVGLVFNGMACTQYGSRVSWVLAVGTPQGVSLYDLSVSAEILPGGGFGKLVFR